jgi:hypothetical protein
VTGPTTRPIVPEVVAKACTRPVVLGVAYWSMSGLGTAIETASRTERVRHMVSPTPVWHGFYTRRGMQTRDSAARLRAQAW